MQVPRTLCPFRSGHNQEIPDLEAFAVATSLLALATRARSCRFTSTLRTPRGKRQLDRFRNLWCQRKLMSFTPKALSCENPTDPEVSFPYYVTSFNISD